MPIVCVANVRNALLSVTDDNTVPSVISMDASIRHDNTVSFVLQYEL